MTGSPKLAYNANVVSAHVAQKGTMQAIIPCLWFNDTAEQAATFYESVFDDAKINRITKYTDAGKAQHGHNAGDVMTVEFTVEGMHFTGLNGGPQFQLNPSISFFVQCEAAEKVDKLFTALSEGGEVLMPLGSYPFAKRYGWVSDKFGVSWQIILVDGGAITQTIIPSLMFTKEHAGQAEAAMSFYTSVFPQSDMKVMMRYNADQAPDKEGTVSYAEFTILGQRFGAMDSAQRHEFTFNEAVSLQVMCKDQQEIDTYWNKLSAVPEAEACGWLKDKYGVSWQIVPTIMDDMLKNGTPEQIERVVAAFMPMKKFDIAELERAYKQS